MSPRKKTKLVLPAKYESKLIDIYERFFVAVEIGKPLPWMRKMIADLIKNGAAETAWLFLDSFEQECAKEAMRRLVIVRSPSPRSYARIQFNDPYKKMSALRLKGLIGEPAQWLIDQVPDSEHRRYDVCDICRWYLRARDYCPDASEEDWKRFAVKKVECDRKARQMRGA